MVHGKQNHASPLAHWGASVLLPVVLTACLSLAGCQSTLDVSNLKNFRQPSEPAAEYADADEPAGPLDRILQVVGRGRKETARRNYRPLEGVAEFEKAEELFKAGQYKQAEKEFKRIAKEYQDTQIEEDALFMLAESRFERKRYSWAQDGYVRLFERFPSTRYSNQATQRLFTIARTWLQFPDVVTTGEIQPVDFDDPGSTPLPKNDKETGFDLTRAVPILPNFIDRTRPVFDTEGRALEALRQVWLNHPTGPLADDALMLSASYHLREGNHMEAARLYKLLREEFPKSQHLQKAFVLGSHVRLMSYQGPAYDGKALNEARQLKESTLRLFSDTPERERLLDELREIDDAQAARDWEMVEFYQKKGKPRAVAVYCRQILNNFPQTAYADRARQKLAELRAQPEGPGLGARLVSVLPGIGGSPSAAEESPAAPTGPQPQDTQNEPGFGQNLLKRVRRVPRLFRAPAPEDADTAADVDRDSP